MRKIRAILSADDRCRRCHGVMLRGVALLNGLVVMASKFGGTAARLGAARLVAVRKCVRCGHSVTL